MRWTCVIAVVLGCLVLGAGAGSNGPTDREFKELVKRVTALERDVDELQQIISRSERQDKERERQREKLERTVANLETALAGHKKDVVAAGKGLADIQERFDKRTLRLADWLDEYHQREGFIRHHRNEIAGIK